ncbi:hypothetical protein BH09SUM1_BH09SUM1_01920 [soil metagenome]
MRLNKKSLFGLMLLAGSLAGAANAQSFRLESVTAAPGDTAHVKVFVTAAEPIAALNFTVSVSGADFAGINGSITGAKSSNGAISSFTYVDNSLNLGSEKQYRGVLYSTTANATFNASTEVQIATINVPISASLTDGGLIHLTLLNSFDTDGVTGLLGISNAAGQSLVVGADPATSRPGKTDGLVTLDEINQNVDFTGGSTLVAGWHYTQILPTFFQMLPTADPHSPSAEALPGTVSPTGGLNVTINALNSFGFLETDVNASPSPIILPQHPDSIMVYSYTLASTGAAGHDYPTVRARSNAADFSFAQDAIYQETQPASPAPVVVPTVGSGAKVLSGAIYVPATVLNGSGTNGLTTSLDFLTFASGAVGTVASVSNFKANSVAISALTGETEVYNHDFSTGNTDGFVVTNSVLNTPGGPYTTTSNSTAGLSLAPDSAGFLAYTAPGDSAPTPGIYYLCFGWWEKVISSWTVATDKIYRVDFRLASTATDIHNTPNARFRFTAGLFDFVQEVVVESNSSDLSLYPDADGTDYTAFVIIPNELAGSQVQVDFDMFVDGSPTQQGAVVLKSFHVRSYNRPTP